MVDAKAKDKGRFDWFNRLACVIDIGVAVFLCVIAARAVVIATFQDIVLGCIEFLIGVFVGIASICKLDILNRYYHFVYTYHGKGILYLLFGVLGLSGDPFKYIFAALTIAVGLLWLLVGCLWRMTPAPFCDFTSGETGPPVAGAAKGGAAATAAFGGDSKKSAGQAAFGEAGPVASKPDNPFAGRGGASSATDVSSKPVNPFNSAGGGVVTGAGAPSVAPSGKKGKKGGSGGQGDAAFGVP